MITVSLTSREDASHVSTKMSASYNPSQVSTLSSFLVLANLVSILCPHSLQKKPPCCQRPTGPTKIITESPCGCSPRCQNGIGVHLKGQRSSLPVLWQSAPQRFCNCGQGLLKYLNDFVNLGIYITFTVGNSTSPNSHPNLFHPSILSTGHRPIPHEQDIFLPLSVTKYTYVQR